jgi:hypothetical protein
MNHYFQEAQDLVIRGTEEKSEYIPLTKHPLSDELSKLGKQVTIGKSQYILLGGQSGAGKTAIVDSQFVLNTYFWWRRHKETANNSLYYIYRSMERPVKYKILKWMAYLMYVEHGILTDTAILAGKPNRRRDITKQEIKLIGEYEKFFDEFFEHIELFNGGENPTGIRNTAMKIAFEKGKLVTSREDGVYINNVKAASYSNKSNGEKREKLYADVTINNVPYRHYEFTKKYFANNPKEIVFHITDHCGKIIAERGMNDKQTLDKHSEYMGEMRDIFEWNIIDIQQLNRGLTDVYRKMNTELDVGPEDFSGTSDLYQNCDLAIGLLNPYKLDVYDYCKYQIKKLVSDSGENRFRGLKVIKNSDGIDDFRIGYMFVGENGMMLELPQAKDLTDADYQKIREAKYI